MSECKQKYIEWSSENGNYCGEYDNGRLIGTDAVNEFDGWEAAWNHQQAKIDELQKRIDGALFEMQQLSLMLSKDIDGYEDPAQICQSEGVDMGVRILEKALRGEND